MKVNNLVMENPRSGIAHAYRREELPLKVFATDEISDSPLTGYYKKDKNKHYYKARDKGVGVNVSAEILNKHFEEILKHFEFDRQHENQMRELLIKKLEGHFKNQIKITNKIVQG